jgi:hypothetical protein
MTTSFPFKFVDLGTALPFKIEANPDFPDETDPVCILDNLATPPAPDTFITIGATPDPWELTFRWATTGGPAAGAWQLDAFLESINPGVGNQQVLGFPVIIPPSASPGKFNQTVVIPPFGGFVPAPGVFLFRLFATLRFGPLPRVSVAGRAEGPLMEFYLPA